MTKGESSGMLYGVVGNPARHSLSPFLHNRFARRTQCQMPYGVYETTADAIAGFFAAFFAKGGAGLNITAPFKHLALDFALNNGGASGFAKRAQAANVLVQKDGGIVGYNTDGAGLVIDIRRHLGITIKGRRVLLAGAGGAARAAALAIAGQQPALLQIAARDESKAQQLAEVINNENGDNDGVNIECRGCQITQCRGRFDIVINATAAGQSGEVPPLPPDIFDNALLALDLSYGKSAKPFLAMARAARQGADGVGMLAEQAAASFALWMGKYPTAAGEVAVLRRITDNHWSKT